LPKDYNNPRDLVSAENAATIGVTINGESKVFPSGTTLRQAVNALELAPERVAIELDRTIVKRDLWDDTTIRDGAQIEIVMFVGGG
jgi:thiamine biosynthesis protein ThiS